MPISGFATSPRADTVHPGIRWVLLGINVCLLIIGGAMVLIGFYVKPKNVVQLHPELWWLGLMPLNIGFVGFISSIIGKSKWLMIWTIYSTLAGTGSYAFFVKYGCLDPETFGATMRIYGNCFQEDKICKCVWSSQNVSLSNIRTCSMIRTSTSLYLGQMFLMTLSLASIIIACFLASITTCCAKYWLSKLGEESSLIQPGTSGVHSSTPSQARHKQGLVYKTDYVPPSSSRTYVTDRPQCSTSML